jgi:hypothetical protein
MLHCITGHGVRARTSHGSLGVTAQHAGGHAWVKRSAGDLYSRSGSCIIACDGVRRTANGESPDCAIHLQASNQRTGMNEHIPITLHSTQFLHITRSEVLQLSSCYSRLQDLQGQGWGSVKNPLAGAVVAWRKTGHLRLAVVTDQGCLTGRPPSPWLSPKILACTPLCCVSPTITCQNAVIVCLKHQPEPACFLALALQVSQRAHHCLCTAPRRRWPSVTCWTSHGTSCAPRSWPPQH